MIKTHKTRTLSGRYTAPVIQDRVSQQFFHIN